MKFPKFRLKALPALAFVLGALATAYATTSYMNQFRSSYPAAASSTLGTCVLCHINPSGGGTRNPYGNDFRTASHSYQAIEGLDSDGDGFTNLQEIQALTLPGDAASHPAISSPDTSPPQVTAFTLPANSGSLTVSFNLFSVTDNVAVTGYLVTESSATPSAGGSGWSATAPASYTFASAGTKTLYAWAKDAAGNVSAPRSATTTITLTGGSDTMAPVITSFTISPTSSSLTVAVTSLVANDNIGITGFLLTESGATPGVNAAGWSGLSPSSYTFASAGSRTLYAWAKDAAGNISASRSSSTSITLPTATDATRPNVTAFTLPATAGALTIPILSYSASDNVGVTGYMVTESSSSPSSGSSGWEPVPISRYTFASTGSKTLYAWAKDAAGNISASRSAKTTIATLPLSGVPKSINSTSRNSSTPPQTQIDEIPNQGVAGYQVVAANDLGMHCGDLDQRVASILPPFNVLHAQVIQKGRYPTILDPAQVEVVYSAASNPTDPAQAELIPTSVYKTNFWDINPRTGRTLAFDAFDAYYPAGILSLFSLMKDLGLPVPDLQELYFGSHTLKADQQAMPNFTQTQQSRRGRNRNQTTTTVPSPQPFALYYRSLPFFVTFPFGYALDGVNWYSAEGIPLTPTDDAGRQNPYPLMRVQARAVQGNSLGFPSGTVIASLDTVTPVSGEVSCGNCHTSSVDGGSGIATDGEGFQVVTRFDDPMYGQVPEAVSLEYAFDMNILRLHDVKHGTNLRASTPVSCQKCHYTPALDLAHVGPNNENGRHQTGHESFSRVMHSFHGSLGLFPQMPSPVGRSAAVRDYVLGQTCYQCHPGRTTQCFRGAMYNAGQACQDCHGDMNQVGNDFSRNVSTGGNFTLAGDFYTNPNTPRVPWANEPTCQSCHTGDVNNNLAASPGAVAGSDGLRLVQAYRAGDANAKPIVAANRRFAENQSGTGSTTKQVLFRLSRGHGGIFCEGCHGSTHAEWPNQIANSNDNVAASQLQGHEGKIVECSTCHGDNAFTTSDFRGNFDSNGLMKGPHGMHPVDQSWISSHRSVFSDSRTPAGTCQACHGQNLEGSPLAVVAADRTFSTEERSRALTKGTQVSCSLCHENPSRSGSDREEDDHEDDR